MTQPAANTGTGSDGGATSTTDTGRPDTDTTAADQNDDDESDAVLGAKGIKALRELRKENRAFQQQIADLKRGASTNQQAPSTGGNNGQQTGGNSNNDSAPRIDEAQLRATIEREYAVKFGADRAKDRATILLQSAGYRGRAERGVRLLDLDGSVKDDGSIDEQAIKDAIDDLKEDEPDRFGGEDGDETSPARARRQVGSADGGRKTPVTTPLTAAQALAAKRFGNKSSRR